MTKNNKMNKYKKRQFVLIICIILVVILIITATLIIVKRGSKNNAEDNSGSSSAVTSTTNSQSDISSTTSEDTSSDAVSSEDSADPVGGDPDNAMPESITVKPSELTMHPGDKKTAIAEVHPANADQSVTWKSSNNSVAIVSNDGVITAEAEGSCIITATSNADPNMSADIQVSVEKEQTQKSEENGLTYINGILVVNKTYSVPAEYAPGLSSEAESAFGEMAAAAAKEGLNIYISSGYRSYDYQNRIYNNYSNIHGQKTADTFSARPGHSEHQTGLAIDMNSIDDSFAGTPEAIWVADNCYKFGFILRYPKGKEDITGYKYEPWHVRYLGKENAKKVFNSGLTLEEYLNIDSKYKN